MGHYVPFRSLKRDFNRANMTRFYFAFFAQPISASQVHLNMEQMSRRRGFTLIELLVVIAILAILGALAFPAYTMAITHAHCAGCTSHMRMLGTAFMLYANDHDAQLPGRAEGTGNDKWPVLLLPYVTSTDAYVDPGDPAATKVSSQDLASNTDNNSSFFFNGFNDLGFYNNPSATVTMPMLTNASTLLLLGEKVHGNTQYYMDFVEGNEDDILYKTSYFGGSNYTFADGSVQFLRVAQYSDAMWLVNKDYAIPSIPAGH
jgi:prepilin-type N-terminal cleavage/methylation domain-containing protein/prepilin-type processing-associated H-X9-DG protein